MLREFNYTFAILSLAVVILSFGQANAEIGFKYTPEWERLTDPTLHLGRPGLTNVLWDSTSIDTTLFDTLGIEFAEPDSLPGDSLVTDSLKIEESKTSPQTKEIEKQPKLTSSSLPEEKDLTSGSTGSSKGQDDFDAEDYEEEAEEEPEEAPWHPTLIKTIDPLVQISTEFDTSSNYVVISHKLYDSDLPFKGAMSVDNYLQRSIEFTDRESWRQSILNKMPTEKESAGTAIRISLPVFKSKRLKDIFGGRNIGLTVTGDINVKGSLRSEKKDESQVDSDKPTDYLFKIDQTQRFHIQGNVGEKVKVEIDQDSERMFEFENNLRVIYTGNEDEIIQKIEAGNVSLSLPGAKFVSGSGKHQGLFGIKTESRIGPLKIITIASLDKSEKNTKKIDGGSESSGTQKIKPYNFIQNRYFFLDYEYREQYKRRNDFDLRHIYDPNRKIIKYDVYRSIRGKLQVANPVQAWALYNPDNLDTSEVDKEHQKGTFQKLEPGADYHLNTELGYIRLNQVLNKEDILAISYQIQGKTYGDFDTPSGLDNTFIFKLLKPKNMTSSDSTWFLMWRHAYDLGASGIEWDGFELRMTLDDGDGSKSGIETYEIGGEVKSLINIFDLDLKGESGNQEPDGKIEQQFVDLQYGVLEFPHLMPFGPDVITLDDGREISNTWFTVAQGGQSFERINPLVEANDTLFNAELYTETSLRGVSSKLEIEVEYENISATYDLGFMVLEGSEVVTLNGRRLNRGTDYNIDYISGTLTVLSKEALTPDAKIEIKWETGQLMQLDTKTVLGMRAEYELWDNSFIGGTFMYRNESTMEKRVRVGGEPIRNSIWDINASLNFQPDFLTRAIDWLPLIETDKASSFTIEGEMAQIYPNPNNLNSPSTGDENGVAYIDDFESVKRSVPLGVTRKLWSASSFPEYDGRGTDKWLRQRGRVIWYNPYQQEKITDIWPERETQASDSKTNVLRMEFQPWWNVWKVYEQWGQIPIDPIKSWGGIMRYLGAGFADQSQSKYLEIWLKRESAATGELYIDLGQISEEVIPDGFLNDEDRPSQSNYLGNGILESSEDTGIDTTKGIDPILGQDPADTLDIDWIDINMDGILLPSFDDYHYSYGGSRNDYSQINGTEGNIRDESGRYPDTEDLDGNSGVNFEDNFFRYRIDLEEGDDNKYIVGGLDNPTGWRLYRIPLSDTLSVGKPLFTSIEYVRIWMTGIDRHVSLKIAQIEIVGNEWQEIQEGTKETPVEPLSVAVINTHDNPEYNEEDHTMPEGVAGEFDPVTQMRSKEQSLVIKINRLRTGEVGRIYKHLMKKINLMNYKYLKMFVHGGNYKQSLSVRGEDLNLEVFFRFGADTSRNYYEYSQILHPGWSEENEILIDLERLTAIKFLREQDSLQNYDILPNGDVMRVVGNPSLSEIKEFVIGIKNFGSEINETDQVEVWVDELRVSDVHRDAGWAARGSMRLEVADLMSFSIDLSQQDANFHRVDSKISSSGNKTALDGKLISSFNLDKFLEPQWGVKIPIKANFNQKVEIPKYKPGSDIRLSALGGEKVDIYSVFNNTLFNNRRMSDNPNYKSPSDSLLTINKGYSFNTSFSKAKKSDNPFIKHSLEKLSLSMNHTEKYITDSRTLYKNSRQNKGSISYSFSLDEPPELSWMGWTSNIPYLNMLSESQFKPVPGSISLGASGSEALTTTKLRTGLLRIDPSASINRNYNVSWHPIEMLSLSFRQQIEADRVIRETLRDTIAAWHVELDSSEFMIPDPEIDSLMILDQERFDLEFEKAKKKVKDELFWQLLGEYMVDNGLSQSFTTSLRPQLFDWLNMDANYSANYRWSWRDSYQPGDRSISSNSSFTTSATFGLQQILGRFLQDKDMQPAPKDDYPGGDDPFGGVDPFGGGSSPFDENIPIDKGSSSLGSSGEEILNQGNLTGLSNSDGVEPDSLLGEIEIADQDTLKEEKPKVDALKPLKEVLKRLRDIRWQYTLSNDISNNSIERGQANWEYRLGLTKDPGLEIVKGFPGNSSHTRRDDHNFSSSLEISRTLRLSSISYEFGKLISSSRTLESINPGNGSESQTIWHYFGKDDDSTDVLLLPILNWSASWSGLSDIEMLKKFTNSISIENSFRGNMNSIWREEQDDSLEVYIRKPQRVDYEKNFTPLIGLSISWLGGVSTNARFNLTQRVSDDKTNLRVKDRAINKSVNVSANYTARRGFRIPIPVWPFKNRKFKNSTSFALTYTFSEEKNERSSNNLPFDSRNTSTSWSVAPTIEYSFSTTVRGGFTYEYSVRKSELAPDVKSQEFGFRVNISIRG